MKPFYNCRVAQLRWFFDRIEIPPLGEEKKKNKCNEKVAFEFLVIVPLTLFTTRRIPFIIDTMLYGINLKCAGWQLLGHNHLPSLCHEFVTF